MRVLFPQGHRIGRPYAQAIPPLNLSYQISYGKDLLRFAIGDYINRIFNLMIFLFEADHPYRQKDFGC